MADRRSLRRRATIYIVDNDHRLLVISRQRNGRSYYVIPGGGVEPGESWAEAAIREAREETSLQVELGPILIETSWEMGEIQQTERAYLVTAFQGTPALKDPEILAHANENNQYRLEWLPLHDLDSIPCYPPTVALTVLQQALDRHT